MSSSKTAYGDESPIAAVATTAGNSALSLIRCSGKGSIELISSVFAPAKIKDTPGNTVIHGWIAAVDEKIDEVLVSVFRAPKSYTGEDSLDICCHGGYSASLAVMSILKTAGFRDALPGEFTFRAFMNGKIDLTRSESVMELVSAKTDIGRRHAVSRLCGSLEKEINDIKDLLVRILAGAEIYLDYSEDEISADAEEIAGRLPNQDIAHQALERLKKLAISWQLERIYQEGITLVIAGRPNAGKSSLFNMLLKEDRSIVTETPGTTRDWIEAWVSIEGIPVRLIDTAGLRESADSVEKIGVERSRKLLQEADLVLYLIDGEYGVTAEDQKYFGAKHLDAWHQSALCESGDVSAKHLDAWHQNALCESGDVSAKHPDASRHLIVWNKCDIALAPTPFSIADLIPICISAKTGEGFTELTAAIASAILEKITGDSELPIAIGTQRQKSLVDTTCNLLEEALALTEREEPLDLIVPLIREAVNALGEITGEVSTADILEEMFSRFCVGK